jgi:hypothetical protein
MSNTDADSSSVQSSSMVTESSIENANILAEYQTLRDDILKRIEFRYQLINLLLIIAGTFYTLGLQPNIPSSVLLIYPILALFLTAGWAHNGVVMVKIGDYLRKELEVNTVGLKWHTHITTSYPQFSSFSFLGTISTSGLVLTTQSLAIVLALIGFTAAQVEVVLLGCSLVAFVATILLLRQTAQLSRTADDG